jgi:hypothetical protein
MPSSSVTLASSTPTSRSSSSAATAGQNVSGATSAWSAGVLRSRRSRQSAAFLRTMGRTAGGAGEGGAGEGGGRSLRLPPAAHKPAQGRAAPRKTEAQAPARAAAPLPACSSLSTSGVSASAISGPATAGGAGCEGPVVRERAHGGRPGASPRPPAAPAVRRPRGLLLPLTTHRLLPPTPFPCGRLTVADERERKALEGLVAADEVGVDRVDGEPQEVVALRGRGFGAGGRAGEGGGCDRVGAQGSGRGGGAAEAAAAQQGISLGHARGARPRTSFMRMEQAM